MPREVINPPSLYTPVGYSHIVQTTGGRVVTIAGQVSIDAGGTIVGIGDFAAQAEKSFENLAAALAAVGATPADLVRTTNYVVDLDAEKVAALRAVRARFFGAVEPATSTLLGVSALAAPEFLFEVDATAVVD